MLLMHHHFHSISASKQLLGDRDSICTVENGSVLIGEVTSIMEMVKFSEKYATSSFNWDDFTSSKFMSLTTATVGLTVKMLSYYVDDINMYCINCRHVLDGIG
ncbi:hypothetical protein HHK36_011221 [Tetracentron sinense]|uniref:Uncharacterized protein n=1 Tax=Tetracentron sinense TaxID=13715 RepID=A0A835DH45_TETSI|nr:hypothetical protein HHK36_011221 [Tetracentron sinense]